MLHASSLIIASIIILLVFFYITEEDRVHHYSSKLFNTIINIVSYLFIILIVCFVLCTVIVLFGILIIPTALYYILKGIVKGFKTFPTTQTITTERPQSLCSNIFFFQYNTLLLVTLANLNGLDSSINISDSRISFHILRK